MISMTAATLSVVENNDINNINDNTFYWVLALALLLAIGYLIYRSTIFDINSDKDPFEYFNYDYKKKSIQYKMKTINRFHYQQWIWKSL